MKKKLSLLLAAVMATAGFSGCGKDESKVVHVYNWGDYMTPYMYMSKERYPLIMALFSSFDYVFPGTSTKLVPVVNAATLFVMIPVFVLFFCCQKQLVEGVTAGGVKG